MTVKPFTFSVGINSYDDPKGLLTILEADGFLQFVDRVYIIEGRYKDRHDKPHHDSKVIEAIVSKYGDKVHYVEMFGATQIQKRNRYMELADENNDDFLLVLDTDEYAIIRPEKLIRELKRMRDGDPPAFVILHNVFLETDTKMPRIIKNPGTYRYKDNKDNKKISHGMIYKDRGEGEIVFTDIRIANKIRPKEPWLEGIKVVHDKRNRSVERAIADEIYYCDNPSR